MIKLSMYICESFGKNKTYISTEVIYIPDMKTFLIFSIKLKFFKIYFLAKEFYV